MRVVSQCKWNVPHNVCNGRRHDTRRMLRDNFLFVRACCAWQNDCSLTAKRVLCDDASDTTSVLCDSTMECTSHNVCSGRRHKTRRTLCDNYLVERLLNDCKNTRRAIIPETQRVCCSKMQVVCGRVRWHNSITKTLSSRRGHERSCISRVKLRLWCLLPEKIWVFRVNWDLFRVDLWKNNGTSSNTSIVQLPFYKTQFHHHHNRHEHPRLEGPITNPYFVNHILQKYKHTYTKELG